MSRPTERRVCLTGIGVITPFANGWRDVYGMAISGGATMAQWAAELDPPCASARLGLVKDYPKARFCSDRQLRLMDRAMTLSVVATGLAFEDADLSEEDLTGAGDHIATVVGSMRGELPSLHRFIAPLFGADRRVVNPAHFPMTAANIACGQVALRFGLRGWSTMISCGEISGLHALVRAIALVAGGRADVAVVGAHETFSKVSLHQIKSRWQKYGRSGLFLDGSNADVPVEGACFFVIESEEHAARRNVIPYAVFGTATHGFLHDTSAEGYRRIVARHMARAATTTGNSVDVISSDIGASEGVVPDRQHGLMQALGEAFGSAKEMRTRQVFGDAGSQSFMLQVASVAQMLKDQRLEAAFRPMGAPGATADPDRPIVGVLATQVTDRGAYGLISLERAHDSSNHSGETS